MWYCSFHVDVFIVPCTWHLIYNIFIMYSGEGASIICAPIGIYQLKEGAYMPNSPNKKNYNANYAKTNLKRIPLDVQKEKYDQIKAAASPFSILSSVRMRIIYTQKAIDIRIKKAYNT